MKHVAAVIAGLGVALMLLGAGGGVSASRPVIAFLQHTVPAPGSVQWGSRLALAGVDWFTRHQALNRPVLWKTLVAMVQARNPLLFQRATLGIYTQVYQYQGSVQQTIEPAPAAPPSMLHNLRQQATAVIHQGKTELLGQSKQSLWRQGAQELLDMGRSQLHQNFDGAIKKPSVDTASVEKYNLNATLDAEAKSAQSEIQNRGPKLDSSGQISTTVAGYSSQVDQHSEMLDHFTQAYATPDGWVQKAGDGGGLGQWSDKLFQHADSSTPSSPLSKLLHGLTDNTKKPTEPKAKEHQKKKQPHGLMAHVSSGVESVQGMVQHSSDRVTHGAGDMVTLGLNRVVKGNPVAERTAVALGTITSTSQGIVSIVATVNDIVVQANLLAVNMVVDTAGATLNGQGYGAVTKEFTGLFKRTASVATRINDLVQNGVGGVQCLVLPGGETERQRALEKAVGQLSGVVQKMTAVATNQLLGLPQIDAAMQLVNKIARLNQDLLTQVTGLGQGLWRQSQRLFGLITSFRQQQAPQTFVPLRRAVATRSDYLQPPIDYTDPLPYPFWR